MTRISEAVDHLPQAVQTSGNWTAVGAALASFFGAIQGPLAVIASGLSIIWLALQIYGWIEKRRKGRS